MENWLAAKAQEYEAKAHRARLDAQRIQGELAQLKSCLVPVKNLHNLKTWESTAASKSRQLVERASVILFKFHCRKTSSAHREAEYLRIYLGAKCRELLEAFKN